MDGRSLSGYQENKIWINDGAGKFQEVASSVGGSLKLDSRAVVYADLWNRGVLDLIVASQNGPVKIYKNHIKESYNWIAFNLVGEQSNRSAIGAQVEVSWNGNRQLQVVSGGSGFSSQNQRPLHFGLGSNADIDYVRIMWPSGAEHKLDSLEINKMHTISENDAKTLSHVD